MLVAEPIPASQSYRLRIGMLHLVAGLSSHTLLVDKGYRHVEAFPRLSPTGVGLHV